MAAPIVAGAAAGGGLGAIGGAALAATPLGWVTTGLSLLSGVSDMFGGGGKVDNSTSAAYSGIGGFNNTNSPVYNKALLDLENPVHILVVGVLIVGGIYAWKKVK